MRRDPGLGHNGRTSTTATHGVEEGEEVVPARGVDPAAAGNTEVAGAVVIDDLALEVSATGAVEDDFIAGVVELGAIEALESKAHVEVTAAFPDVGRALVHACLEDAAAALLAVAGAAATGADSSDHVVVDVYADRVITRGADLDEHLLAGGVLDVGRRDRDEVVGTYAGGADVGIEVHQVIFAVGADTRGGYPGGDVAPVGSRPASGLSGTEVDVPLGSRGGIGLVDIKSTGPVAFRHAANAATAATGFLVEDQHVPALGADPATGVDVVGVDRDVGSGFTLGGGQLVVTILGIPAVNDDVVSYTIFGIPSDGGAACPAAEPTVVVVVTADDREVVTVACENCHGGVVVGAFSTGVGDCQSAITNDGVPVRRGIGEEDRRSTSRRASGGA